jgi:hypothetical protein
MMEDGPTLPQQAAHLKTAFPHSLGGKETVGFEVAIRYKRTFSAAGCVD